MTADELLIHFVEQVCEPNKARRYVAVLTLATKKGRSKFIAVLSHGFNEAIKPHCALRKQSFDPYWDAPCLAFASLKCFGEEFATLREAYEALALADGWLILLKNSAIGIYRPEGSWDDEHLIVAQQ